MARVQRTVRRASGVYACGGTRGVWSHVIVDAEDRYLYGDAGVWIAPGYNLTAVRGNFTDLLAFLEAMAWLPERWSGTICTGSGVILRWLASGQYSGSVPVPLRERLSAEFERLGTLTVVKVDHEPWLDLCKDRCEQLLKQIGGVSDEKWV